ncbi:hypothetical protein [Rhodanobacter geophilus]|uniref:Uncharacterized protein n=1 Tax=Rhodanobacter geophilus TaxID=3162488 RepID=A0ABV3QL71_9GAMM
MTDTQQLEPIRLVPLVEAVPDADQQSRILALAAESKLRLYVPVPLERVVYTGSAKLDVSSCVTPTVRQKMAEAKRRGALVIKKPTLCREVDFLALAPNDAQSLLVARMARVQQFPGGLKLIPAKVEHEQSGLEFVPAQLYLRPAGETIDRGPWILEAGEHAIRIDWQDVLLDRRAIGMLKNSVDTDVPIATVDGIANTDIGHGTLPAYVPFEDVPEEDQPLPPPLPMMKLEEDDPFNLRSRAPAVFVLYAAAKYFFDEPRYPPIKQNLLEDWFSDRRVPVIAWITQIQGNYAGLTRERNVRLAFKLIHPKNDKRKWASSDYQSKEISPAIVDEASKYRENVEHYVSKRLSVVILALDHWEQLNKVSSDHQKNAVTAEHQVKLMDKLRDELRKWRFDSDDERKTIVDFVTWPQRYDDLQKQIKSDAELAKDARETGEAAEVKKSTKAKKSRRRPRSR